MAKGWVAGFIIDLWQARANQPPLFEVAPIVSPKKRETQSPREFRKSQKDSVDSHFEPFFVGHGLKRQYKMTILPVCKTTQKWSFNKSYTTSNLTVGELDLMFGTSKVKIGWLLVGLGISQHQQSKYKGGKAAGLSHPVAATKF